MLLLLGLLALLAAGETAPPAAPPVAAPEPVVTSSGLVEIEAIVLVVGAKGSEQTQRERAVLSPGRKGLLQVSVPLPGGGEPVVETVAIDLRLRLEGGDTPAEGVEPATARIAETRRGPLRIAIDSTARPAPTGEVVLRSGGGELSLPGSIWFEPYVSAKTGQRVVIHLSARSWVQEEEVVPRTGIAEAPAPVTYRLWIYRRTASGLDLVEAPVLGSLVGQTASYTFSFRLEPEGASQPRESLQAELHAVEISDGVLTGTATLSGVLRGRPVRAEAPWGLRNREQAFLTLRLPVADGTADLGFEIAIVAAF
jgi:hypothetical protein